MSYTRRNLEELNIMDDFLMSAVASDRENGEEFCRLVLSTLLEQEIGKVRVTVQRTIPALTPELRGIRMDVEVLEEPDDKSAVTVPIWNIYDLEPHIRSDTHLPRHNRFYQARIDSRYMKSGAQDFSKMPNLYMITITPYDPFGLDYMVYRFRNQCQEIPTLVYEDGIQHLYFYTKGSKGGTPAIRAMLDYFQDSRAENAAGEVLQKIHHYVNYIKISPEVKDEFMRLEEYVQERVAIELDLRKDEIKAEFDLLRENAKNEMKKEVTKEVRKEVTEEVRKEITEEVTKDITEQVTKDVTEQVTKDVTEQVTLEYYVQNILEFLEDYGQPPAALKQRLQKETDPSVLKKWLKLAAKADSLADFEAGL